MSRGAIDGGDGHGPWVRFQLYGCCLYFGRLVVWWFVIPNRTADDNGGSSVCSVIGVYIAIYGVVGDCEGRSVCEVSF